MATEAEINSRANRLEDADIAQMKKTLHGIGARLDRLPIGGWHWKLLGYLAEQCSLTIWTCILAVALLLHC